MATAKMTRRERLRRCYFHEQLDRPGVYCRTGFPENDPTYDTLKACLSAHTELKGHWSSQSVESATPTELLKEPYSEDFERHIFIIHTPAGDLRASWLVSLRGQPGLQNSYFLKTAEDARKYLSLPMPELSGDVSAFFKADQEMGDCGIVEVHIGFNPAGMVAELFGSEGFAAMSVTDREALHQLCERQMNMTLRRLNHVLSRGAGPYFTMAGEEYLVPPLHGPRDFYDFNVRYDKPIIDLIHDAGGRVHIHCHGSIKKVIQGFVDMGTDVLHPFEPPPLGDITPAEAKAVARGKICLEGNIQIADMYERTPEQMREQTVELIEATFDDSSGLIVCPSASPYIRGWGERCFPQFKAMIDTVLKWSHRP